MQYSRKGSSSPAVCHKMFYFVSNARISLLLVINFVI